MDTGNMQNEGILKTFSHATDGIFRKQLSQGQINTPEFPWHCSLNRFQAEENRFLRLSPPWGVLIVPSSEGGKRLDLQRFRNIFCWEEGTLLKQIKVLQSLAFGIALQRRPNHSEG
ncbi:hypothetical protein AVEN_244734-1 [Araneus ventricosus]|uniref:Uncharacterized protein n=1 Tax=Araneus ventricosus TaxID=182803 RepID=A0A4Y1ZSU3_ARAVE|nr:hypothetical protein AVEN_195214-1 [Araneus ventricosus]GBL94748.1 hypothetical protein AVEN_244734-1 [Araneus ventricosus]